MPSYKKLAQDLEMKQAPLERELARLKKEEEERKEAAKKRWDAIVYCENCQEVNSVSIPAGVSIASGDCTTCRVRGMLKLVKKAKI